MWPYLIKKKIVVFTMFKKFKLHVEKKNDYAIKRLRINGEGEYISI